MLLLYLRLSGLGGPYILKAYSLVRRLFFFKIYFVKGMHTCVCIYVNMHVTDQKRVSNPLELEPQAIVSCLV